jgi:hypothetical protein
VPEPALIFTNHFADTMEFFSPSGKKVREIVEDDPVSCPSSVSIDILIDHRIRNTFTG